MTVCFSLLPVAFLFMNSLKLLFNSLIFCSSTLMVALVLLMGSGDLEAVWHLG